MNNFKQELKESIGNRLRELRHSQHLTQEAMAEKIDISDKAYQKYEQGNALPPTDKIMYLCEAFNVSADFLLFGKDKDASSLNKKHFENIVSYLQKEFNLSD